MVWSKVGEGGINRNIVECKGENRILHHACPDGINRNIVECKVIRSGIRFTYYKY